MPQRQATARAQRAKREGKAATTQAGEYVREEVRRTRGGKGGRSRQAVAIGLSRARRAGVNVPPPERGRASEKTRRKATRDLERGRRRPAKANGGARKGARTTERASTTAKRASTTTKPGTSARGQGRPGRKRAGPGRKPASKSSRTRSSRRGSR